jgi:RNA polymerase sigma-32 factor
MVFERMSGPNSSPSERSDHRYFAAVFKAPMLEREEERQLGRRWREEGDEEALHRLVESHVRLVVKIAQRYRKSGIPLHDLVQEGSVGLMEAAARFDPEYDNRFATYASWWIASMMQSYIMRNLSVVRAPTTRDHKRIFFNLRRLRASLALNPHGTLGDEMRERIATELKVRVTDVELVDTYLASPDRSLNALVRNAESNGTSTELQEMIADDGPSPEIVVMQCHDARNRAVLLKGAMTTLTHRERQIIEQHFLRETHSTLAELGGAFGVSKQRIGQIEKKALGKVRAAMTRLVEDPSEFFDS